MLLRRLAAATGHAEPGRPLGRICPVATSATLGERRATSERDPGGRRAGLRRRVRRGLGDRRAAASRPDEFLGRVDYGLPLPDAAGTRRRSATRRLDAGRDGGDRQARSPGRTDLTRRSSARVLRRHILTHALIEVLGDKPSTSDEILETCCRARAPTAGARRSGSSPRAGRGRPGPVRRAAVDGPRTRTTDPAVPAHRDPPVDPAAEPGCSG